MQQGKDGIDDDKELFGLIAQNDQAAFTKLFHKYNRRLFPFLLKIVKSQEMAEELIQNLFFKVWNRREKLTAVDSPQAYLYRMASNLAMDELKRIARQEQLLNEPRVLELNSEWDNSTEETIYFNESKRLVDDAINSLPPQRQKIFRMSKIQGMNYDEIAEEMGISRNTVKNQLVAAVKYLKNHLGETAILLLMLMD